MKRTNTSMTGLLAVLFAALVLAVMGAGPAAASSDTSGGGATTAAAEQPPNYNACLLKYFCVYDKYGHMCKWKDDAPDWYAACSWIGRNYPKYAYNHIKPNKGVTIYRYTGYHSAIGDCIRWEEQVVLAGNYMIGSHRKDCK